MAKPRTQKIELADVLAKVREELIKANDAAMKTGRPVMVFDECEVECAFALEEDLKVGFKLYFLQLGAGQKKSDSNTVKVKYKPLDGGLVAATGDTLAPAEAPVRQTKPEKR